MNCSAPPCIPLRSRRLAAGSLLAVAAVAVGCTGDPIGRDPGDTTPPTFTLTVTASANAPGGLEDVPFGGTADLTPPGGSILIKASDPNGVSFVEIWLNTERNCGGTITGPGLGGGPAKRVDGTITPTSAPRTLTAIFDLNTQPRRAGCSYRFEVSGRAANAAATPVEASTATTILRLAL